MCRFYTPSYRNVCVYSDCILALKTSTSPRFLEIHNLTSIQYNHRYSTFIVCVCVKRRESLHMHWVTVHLLFFLKHTNKYPVSGRHIIKFLNLFCKHWMLLTTWNILDYSFACPDTFIKSAFSSSLLLESWA